MTIDNFDLISSLLDCNENEFYFVQIIQRNKENPQLGSNNVVKNSYYISSKKSLINIKEEVIALCKLYNARAYINLNKRSYEQIAYQALKNVTDRIINKDFKSIRRAYNTCCGQFSHETSNSKKWIIDVDDKSLKLIEDIKTFINFIEPLEPITKLVAVIPTRQGYHLITTPFRVDLFKIAYPFLDIHKNNPTLLFYTDNI